MGGSRFFEQPEIAHIRAFCRVVVNGADDEALALFLSSPLGGVRPDALWRLAHASERTKGPGGLWAAAIGCVLPHDGDQETLHRAIELVKRARHRLGGVALGEVILRAIEESDFDLWMLGGEEEGRLAYANILKLARMAAEFERAEGRGIAAFLDYLDAKERVGDHERPATLSDDKSPGVRIMSVHASKGLEFPVVAVSELGASVRSSGGIVRVRVDEGRVRVALSTPSDDASGAVGSQAFNEMDALDKTEEIQESKRLLYVACTRAEEVLLLSGSANLDKPPTQNTPLAWIRQALAVHTGDGGEEATRKQENSAFRIRRVEPGDNPAEGKTAADGLEVSSSGDHRSGHRDGLQPRNEVSVPSRMNDMNRLAYSDIAGYEACSLRFMATRLWRVGTLVLEEEGDPRHFGSALHALMRSCVESDAPVSEQVGRVASRFHLGSEEEGRLHDAASRLLGSQFWAQLEPGSNMRAEVPFQIEITTDGDAGFILAGAMDLYVRQAEQGVILDYKTGTSGTAEELRDRYEMQARSYALAALRDGCTRVSLEFIRPEVIGETGEPQRISYEYSEDDIPAIEAEIRQIRSAMLKGPHVPLSKRDASICGDCPIAGNVCPLPVPVP